MGNMDGFQEEVTSCLMVVVGVGIGIGIIITVVVGSIIVMLVRS